jgi:hypothetical protein
MFNFLLKSPIKLNVVFFWSLFFFNKINFFNFFFFLIIWLIVFIFSFNNKISFNTYYINFNYFSYLLLNKWLFVYYFNFLYNFFNKLTNFFKIFFNIDFFLYKWNPIIKQYSYYGYFKSNISHWNYSKTDELKNFKF